MNKLAVFLLLLLGLLQYRLWFGDGNLLEFRRLNERIEELRREGDKRRERNAALEAEVMDLKQGLDAIEERARQDLGMIKEGEIFVQIIDPHHESVAPAQPLLEPETKSTEPLGQRQRLRKAKHPKPEQPHIEPETEQSPAIESAPPLEPSGKGEDLSE